MYIDKNKYIEKERRRWAHYFNIPIVQTAPEGFPPRTLSTQRALCAISLKHPDKLVPAFETLYHLFWVEGNPNIAQPECFGPALEGVLGKDVAQSVLADVCYLHCLLLCGICVLTQYCRWIMETSRQP